MTAKARNSKSEIRNKFKTPDSNVLNKRIGARRDAPGGLVIWIPDLFRILTPQFPDSPFKQPLAAGA
jgi:hypothetical protein